MATETEVLSDPQFDVFHNESIDVSADGVWIKILQPVHSLANDGDINFEIEGDEKHWLQWGESFISLEAKIRKYNASGDIVDLEKGDEVIFVNNAAHSIFQDVNIKINHNAVEGGNSTYAWLAYMNNLIQFNQAAKGTHMLSQGYHLPITTSSTQLNAKKDGLDIDQHKWDVNENAINQVIHKASHNKFMHFQFPLKIDLFQQGKSCPPGFRIDISLVRNNPRFALFEMKAKAANQRYKIVLQNVKLHLPMIDPNPRLQALIARKRQNSSILYQFNHLNCFRYTIVAGNVSKVLTNIFQNKQPKLAIFALVKSKTLIDINARPFIFHRHKLSTIALTTEGRMIGGDIIKCADDMNVFSRFNQALSMFNSNEDVGIDLDQFKEYSWLAAFDCTPSSNVDALVEPSRRSYDLELLFEAGVTDNLELFCFFIEDKRVIIQSNNNVVPNDFIAPNVKEPKPNLKRRRVE